MVLEDQDLSPRTKSAWNVGVAENGSGVSVDTAVLVRGGSPKLLATCRSADSDSTAVEATGPIASSV